MLEHLKRKPCYIGEDENGNEKLSYIKRIESLSHENFYLECKRVMVFIGKQENAWRIDVCLDESDSRKNISVKTSDMWGYHASKGIYQKAWNDCFT